MTKGLLAVLFAASLAPYRPACAQGGQNSQNPSWFIFGRVTMSDGSPPVSDVSIESLCGAQAYVVAVTDSKGSFSFRYGAAGNRNLQDASVGLGDGPFTRPAASLGAPPNGSTQSSSGSSDSQQNGGATQQQQQQTSPSTTPRPGFNDRQLRTCDIRASLPGYRSDVVSFANRRPTDNPDLGTLILHSISRSKGLAADQVISVAALAVPDDARKAYEAGLAALKRKKPEVARADFEKAARLYPRYAAAWCEIGTLDAQQGRADDAIRSFDQAIGADSSSVESYLRLSGLLAERGQWTRLGETAGRLLKLDPFDYPQAYFYRAAAEYHAGDLQASEKDAREAERLDHRGQWPETWRLLGRLCAARGAFAEAAQQVRRYLTLVPQSPAAAALRAQAADYEQRAAHSSARANPPQ